MPLPCRTIILHGPSLNFICPYMAQGLVSSLTKVYICDRVSSMDSGLAQLNKERTPSVARRDRQGETYMSVSCRGKQ